MSAKTGKSVQCHKIGCEAAADKVCNGCKSVAYCSDVHAAEDWAKHYHECNIHVAENANMLMTIEANEGFELGEAEDRWVPMDLFHELPGDGVTVASRLVHNAAVAAAIPVVQTEQIDGEAKMSEDNKQILFRSTRRLPRGAAHRGERVDLFAKFGDKETTFKSLSLPAHAHYGLGFSKGYNVYVSKDDIIRNGGLGYVESAGLVAVGLDNFAKKYFIWGNYAVKAEQVGQTSFWQRLTGGAAKTLKLPKMVRVRGFDNTTQMQMSFVLEQDPGAHSALAQGMKPIYAVTHIEMYVPATYTGGYVDKTWGEVLNTELGSNTVPPAPATMPSTQASESSRFERFTRRTLPEVFGLGSLIISAESPKDVAFLNDALDDLYVEDTPLAAQLDRVQAILTDHERALEQEGEPLEISAEVAAAVCEGEQILLADNASAAELIGKHRKWKNKKWKEHKGKHKGYYKKGKGKHKGMFKDREPMNEEIEADLVDSRYDDEKSGKKKEDKTWKKGKKKSPFGRRRRRMEERIEAAFVLRDAAPAEIAPVDVENIHDVAALLGALAGVRGDLEEAAAEIEAGEDYISHDRDALQDHAEIHAAIDHAAQLQAVLHEHLITLKQEHIGSIVAADIADEVYEAAEQGQAFVEIGAGLFDRIRRKRALMKTKSRLRRDMKDMNEDQLTEKFKQLVENVRSAQEDAGRVGTDEIALAYTAETEYRRRGYNMSKIAQQLKDLKKYDNAQSGIRSRKRKERRATRRKASRQESDME